MRPPPLRRDERQLEMSSSRKPVGRFWSLLLALGLAVTARAADPATSAWVHPGPDGRLVYKTTPAGDRIMDFSYAGYMGGGVRLPDVPLRKTVRPSGGA